MDVNDARTVCNFVGGQLDYTKAEPYAPDSIVCSRDGDPYGDQVIFEIGEDGDFHCE